MSRVWTPIVAAVALFGATVPGLAQGAGNDTPQANVRASKQYDQLLCTNKAFQAKRIAQECGSLQGSQFYDSCVASFDCKKPVNDTQWRNAPPSETTK